MTGKSANEVPVLAGKAGMRAFADAFMTSAGPPKAVVVRAENSTKNRYVICSVGDVRLGMTSDEARVVADSSENAFNEFAPGRRTPVTELCMTIREAAARADKWAAR